MYSIYARALENNVMTFGCQNIGWKCHTNQKIYNQFRQRQPDKSKSLKNANNKIDESVLNTIINAEPDVNIKQELEEGKNHLIAEGLVMTYKANISG